MIFVVGLTGGIGCGKSKASQLFHDLGVDIVDTDEISKKLTQLNGAAIPSIRDMFGEAFITDDGALDRQKMRHLVFSDNCYRLKLEGILHPLIFQETVRGIAAAQSPYVIVVVPLLFETSDYDDLFQRILVIDCDEQRQIERTMIRSQLSDEQVKAIMATQVSRQFRLSHADDVIENNQDIKYLEAQVKNTHSKYMELSVLYRIQYQKHNF